MRCTPRPARASCASPPAGGAARQHLHSVQCALPWRRPVLARPSSKTEQQQFSTAAHAKGPEVSGGARCAHLGAPREVARVQAQRAELVVAAAAAHFPDRHVGRELGVGRLPAQLEPGGRRAAQSAPLGRQVQARQRAAGCASTETAPSDGCARDGGGTHFLFLRHFFCLPPVRRRLCSESREMPARSTRAPVKPRTQQRAPAPAC
jgi:hypothetical protein